jgi:general secretion pathway protein A
MPPSYLDFFDLTEEPFRITPDPRYLWYSDQHKAARAKIMYHIQSRRGPIYLFADVGTGKTTIARRIHEELLEDKTKRVVMAFAPKLKTTNAFLRSVMDEFDVPTRPSYAVSLNNFQEYLLAQYQAGICSVLLVDEAQNMTPDMLKLIHHLFNFTTNTEFLIQIALFGQNELHNKIHGYSSLQSRMTPAQLQPFDLEGTRQMIAFRWQMAGGKELPFNTEAVTEVFRLTGGNPRDICKLCDTALLTAFGDERKLIDHDTVQAAALEVFVTGKADV